MAVIAGTIKGIQFLGDPPASSGMNFALVSVTFGAYSTSDTAIVSSVDAAIQNRRRDGLTVTLKDCAQAWSGKEGSTEVFLDTLAVSTSDITGELADVASTEISLSGGVDDRACTFLVSYLAA